MQTGMIKCTPRTAALFGDFPCLHGVALAAANGRGRMWCDQPMKPSCAVAAVGDFILSAGVPGLSARRLLRNAMQSDRREWLVYAPGAWTDALPPEHAFAQETRWAFRHDAQPEDARLRALAAPPNGNVLQPSEGAWIDACRKEAWSRDFVQEFADDDDYAANGLGMLLLEGGRPVAGASSYVVYPGGLEVQVQTREGCEGRGLATIAAAQLILAAYARGLCVSWDAANPASARIAEKLGYVQVGAYTVFALKR